MLQIWTANSGTSLGTIQERTSTTISLPVSFSNTFNDSSALTYTVISGALPPGLRLNNDKIVGSAFEVPRTTDFTFCIRASYDNDIADRTFKITVEGADEPVFVTQEGTLPIGTSQAYFILDSSLVDFQIDAIDTDTAAGQTLKYFISSGDGELPPGLSMSDSGRITGFIQPLPTVPTDNRTGSYGEDLFDSYGYDYGSRPDNGYDSFIYDSVFFDYFLPTLTPRKLNRNYEFIVTVSDGDNISKRKFLIYVVGDDFLRADNTLVSAGNGVFTVDGTYLRAPIWITPSDLGLYRANNYITIYLDTYDAPVLGPVVYSLDTVNPDSTPSLLPPNMQFDIRNSEIFGIVPYQPAITKTYKFTVTASRFGSDGEIASSKRTFTMSTLGEVDSVMNWLTPSSLGSVDANYITTLRVTATSTVENATILYSLITGSLPPGLTLQLNGEITGKVNQYGSLGSPGVTTFSDTDILGNVYNNQTFDGGTTTVDREYKFVIRAKDEFEYSFIDREFVIKISTPNDRLYSNISARTFMIQNKRDLFNGFIDDNVIFTPNSIYRPNDINFGIQRDLRMLVYAGIETKAAERYVSAIGLNHKKKRFVFGNIKSAKAKIPGTNDVVYEIIYVEMIDPLEKGNKKLNSVINTSRDPNTITVDTDNSIWDGRENLTRLNRDEPFAPRPFDRTTIDQTDLFVSDPNPTKRFPSSITNWRDRISAVGSTERNYLPLWMRSVQDDAKQELGFVLAVPICYCNPGTSADILLNIKFSGFDFKNLDYTVDRYIIDSVTGYGSDKYLVFKNDRVTIT
jgi:hypothetical protein